MWWVISWNIVDIGGNTIDDFRDKRWFMDYTMTVTNVPITFLYKLYSHVTFILFLLFYYITSSQKNTNIIFKKNIHLYVLSNAN